MNNIVPKIETHLTSSYRPSSYSKIEGDGFIAMCGMNYNGEWVPYYYKDTKTDKVYLPDNWEWGFTTHYTAPQMRELYFGTGNLTEVRKWVKTHAVVMGIEAFKQAFFPLYE